MPREIGCRLHADNRAAKCRAGTLDRPDAGALSYAIVRHAISGRHNPYQQHDEPRSRHFRLVLSDCGAQYHYTSVAPIKPRDNI